MFDLQGVKVAVIGFTTEDTYKLVLPDTVADLVFEDPSNERAVEVGIEMGVE